MNIELSRTLILDLPTQVPVWKGQKLQYGFPYLLSINSPPRKLRQKMQKLRKTYGKNEVKLCESCRQILAISH